jgi:hypothetical protein
MRRDDAEDAAVLILGWIAEAGLWDAFAAQSGTDAGAFRAAMAKERSRGEALGAVLDFVMTRDDWAVAAAAAAGLRPESLAGVRGALPGGGQVHWT